MQHLKCGNTNLLTICGSKVTLFEPWTAQAVLHRISACWVHFWASKDICCNSCVHLRDKIESCRSSTQMSLLWSGECWQLNGSTCSLLDGLLLDQIAHGCGETVSRRDVGGLFCTQKTLRKVHCWHAAGGVAQRGRTLDSLAVLWACVLNGGFIGF